jgi:hypothetical protein
MSNSIHDLVVQEIESRPLPDEFAPLPDLIDVYLAYCQAFYGDKARSVAIATIRQQKEKGLLEYGVPLTLETEINAKSEMLEDFADAICYHKCLPRTLSLNEALDRGVASLEQQGESDAAAILRRLNETLLGEAIAAQGDAFLEEELVG